MRIFRINPIGPSKVIFKLEEKIPNPIDANWHRWEELEGIYTSQNEAMEAARCKADGEGYTVFSYQHA